MYCEYTQSKTVSLDKICNSTLTFFTKNFWIFLFLNIFYTSILRYDVIKKINFNYLYTRDF